MNNLCGQKMANKPYIGPPNENGMKCVNNLHTILNKIRGVLFSIILSDKGTQYLIAIDKRVPFFYDKKVVDRSSIRANIII